MFATHALVPGDIDGLQQPALALSTPDVTKSKDDGLLTMSEVLSLKINTQWVVLSACNTGTGSGEAAGATWGIGSAFLYAGSQSLLVTHWPVETTSAKYITTNLFRNNHEQNNNRVKAFGDTLRNMIQQGSLEGISKEEVAYAHPMFWAPFAMVSISR